jgi:hypothetical protein
VPSDGASADRVVVVDVADHVMAGYEAGVDVDPDDPVAGRHSRGFAVVHLRAHYEVAGRSWAVAGTRVAAAAAGPPVTSDAASVAAATPMIFSVCTILSFPGSARATCGVVIECWAPMPGPSVGFGRSLMPVFSDDSVWVR